MLEFFRRKKTKSDSPSIMYYKSGEEFFQSQCEFGHTAITKNTAVVALVLDAQQKFGTPTAISVGQDGAQRAALLVASEDGGFLVFAMTPSAKGERLQPGDIVLWVPYEYNEEIGDKMSDKRSGWIGLIRAKIKPETNPATKSFAIACQYN